MRLFNKFLNTNDLARDSKYLEIGPGHGEYFVTAMQQTNFSEYVAVDISKTSVELTQNFILHSKKNVVIKNMQCCTKIFLIIIMNIFLMQW
jgi:tRNA G46 methylase TrmB